MTVQFTVEDVSLRFAGVVALDRISLAVAPRELLAVVGPNGAGKTSSAQLHSWRLPGKQRPHHVRGCRHHG